MNGQERHNLESAVVASGLEKSYGRVKVLAGLHLTVPRGSVLALLGPNGAGKTTAIRILSTLLKPDAGRATILGYDVVQQPEEVRKVISLTGQFAAVDELLTGEENALMLGRLYHLSGAVARRRTAALLEQFELSEAARRPVKTYSGGMRRRLDLALSLIATPPVLFLDEPTTGLDPRSRMTMWELIRDLRLSGVTVLLTTQYLEEADRLADRIAVLDAGRIIAEGTADELKRQVGQERLELALAHPDGLERVGRALDGQVWQPGPDGQAVSVAIDGSPRHVKAVLDQLEQAAVEVTSLTLRSPTLDDVFLALTGQAHGPAKKEGAAHHE